MGPVVFADTAFWIALASLRDQYHSRALAWSQFLVRTEWALITTEAVLWEWLNALSHPSTRGQAAEGYRRCHQDAHVEVVGFDPDLVQASVRLYESRPDKSWSLTDCSAFVVMQQHQITDALTTDHDFHQAGFRALLLEEPPTA